MVTRSSSKKATVPQETNPDMTGETTTSAYRKKNRLVALWQRIFGQLFIVFIPGWCCNRHAPFKNCTSKKVALTKRYPVSMLAKCVSDATLVEPEVCQRWRSLAVFNERHAKFQGQRGTKRRWRWRRRLCQTSELWAKTESQSPINHREWFERWLLPCQASEIYFI